LRLLCVLAVFGFGFSEEVLDAPPYDENEQYMKEVNPDLFEGDIEVGSNFRNIMQYDSKRWPNGVVPYQIDNSYSSASRNAITSAMAEMKKLAAVSGKTCIQFVPRSNQRNYIYIHPGGGCSSWVGVSGGMQKVSLGRGCVYKGTIQHELLHALGFWHEQSRTDRDKYVDIFWNNIASNMRFNFNIEKGSRTLGTPYDYDSVMHYGPYSFSTNRQATILPKDRSKKIGNRNGMSANDIRKLRILYKCGSGTEPVVTQPPVVIGGGECRNTHSDQAKCDEWSKGGYCTNPSNSDWMKIHCTKSCNKCPGSSCQNKHHSTAECDNWAQMGECFKNPYWMKPNCARSCVEC